MGNSASVDECDAKQESGSWWWPSSPANPTQSSPTTMEEATQVTIANIIDDEEDNFEAKREQRRQILAAKKCEMHGLRNDLEALAKENAELRAALVSASLNKSSDDSSVPERLAQLQEENARLKIENASLGEEVNNVEELRSRNRELSISVAEVQLEVQRLNSDLAVIENERAEYEKHVSALKDVVKLTKEMVQIREDQIEELRKKQTTMEELLASKEMKVMSDDLRQEYERQLLSIRNLRNLYEVRQRVERREKDQLQETVQEQKQTIEEQQAKILSLDESVEKLKVNNSEQCDKISQLESNLGLSRAECRDLQSEINVINQLFSQILVAVNTNQALNLDKLTKNLEENHDLLADIITNEPSLETSASLSKVLLDLVNQTEEVQNSDQPDSSEVTTAGEVYCGLPTIPEETESHAAQLNSTAEIMENLPKVWRVLIELLSQQLPPCNIEGTESTQDACYKTVDTPKGPKLVLSVSQTFIRLKDLIVEKKALEKEMGRLKNLNGHLEGRLHEQEKRLGIVSTELTNTWHVVGEMQKQHHLLHSQEKILRMELAHKRKMLNELKEELEYCRAKWEQAKVKNASTEAQWRLLRSEFASRKVQTDNYSAESGYSDDKSSSDDEELEPDKSDDIVSAIEPSAEIELVSVEELATEHEVITSTELPSEEVSVNAEEVPLITDCHVQTSQLEAEVETEPTPGPSNANITNSYLEERLQRREERLKRLEEQCKSLVTKMTKTSERSHKISDKLDNLHEIYGDTSQTTSDTEAQTSDEREAEPEQETVDDSESQDQDINQLQ